MKNQFSKSLEVTLRKLMVMEMIDKVVSVRYESKYQVQHMARPKQPKEKSCK